VIILEKLTKGKMGRDTSDPAKPRVGIVMDIRGRLAYLRPVGGGFEWSAPLSNVEPYALSSALRPTIAEINDRASHPTR
jgi:hypothetical protein